MRIKKVKMIILGLLFFCTACIPVPLRSKQDGSVEDFNDESLRTQGEVAGVVKWTADGVAICEAADNQDEVQIVIDGKGGAIITWRDNRNSGSSGYDIYAQRINSAGSVE